MQTLLYCDLGKQTVSETPGGGAFSWPKLLQGDDIRVKLRFVERVGGEVVEATRTLQALRATLGRDDARPESGTFRLKVGGGSPVIGTNVTAALDFDATAAEVAAAINALSGLTGSQKDVTCELVDDSWRVRLEDGTETTFAIAENGLFPVSFLRFRTSVVDGITVHELRLSQSPVAFTDAFDAVVPEAPTIARVRAGGNSNGAEWNEVQKLTVPPQFRGTYQIARGYAKSPLLSIDDGVEEIAAALEPLADDDGEFVVTNPTGNAAHIEFTGSMGGQTQDLLTVSVFDAPAGDPTFVMSLDTDELAVFLNRRPTTPEKLVLEVEAEIEDEQDDETTYTVTLFRSEVEVVREVGWESLNSAQNIDWLRPPLPKSYIPFVADQVNTGVLHYQTTLGNGVLTAFTVDHELGSESVAVVIRENSTPGDVLRIGTDYTLVIEDDQSVTVTLLGTYASSPPASGALAITIMALGEASAFDAHTHTIAQIVDLESTLEALGTRVETLETLVGVAGTVTSDSSGSTGTIAEWSLPTFAEVYPIRKMSEALEKVEAIADITAAMLPRAGGLLPAIHDAVLEALPADLDDGEEGHLYQNQSGETVILPGGMGRKSVKLLDDEFATVLLEDGRASWYRIAPVAVGETSYYPTDFDRELFRLAINDKQLRLSKKLTVEFAIEAALLKANTNAQWLLRIEHGAYSEDSTPEGSGITVTGATTDILTATAHGLADGAAVKFSTTGTLPAGLVVGTKYFVRDATANTFKVSATLGGDAVDITSTGSGTHTVKAQTRTNLASIAWNPVPILEQRIDLTSVAGIHEFGCTVTRSAGGVMSATALLYKGTQGALSAPASANFFLRARLCGFDTENGEADPRGFVALLGLARAVGDEAAESLGKAVIGSA